MKKTLRIIISAILICTTVISLCLPVYAAGGTKDLGDVREFGDFSGLSGHVIFYPESLEEGNGKYPVIVWANGTVCPPALYTELFKGFAKSGYVVVSSSNVMSADGVDQCNSIDYIFELNDDPDSRFYNKIDKNKIAAVGHSQGGRSSVNAAKADSRIKCVLSIAGSNTKDERSGLTTPTFFMTGTADLIVPSGIWVKPTYEKAQGPAVYASLVGGIHTTSMISPNSILRYAVTWLDGVLYGEAESLAVFKEGGALSQDKNWKSFASKNIDDIKTGSVISAGDIWIIAGAAAACAAVVAVLIIKNKKRA